MSISTKTRIVSSINLIRESARDFALQYIKPYVMDWDESQHFPKEVLQKAGEYGFMGILVPEELGGSGLGYHEYVAIIDEISRVDPSIGLSIAAHNSLCTNHIFKFGSSEQHNKYLKLLASGLNLRLASYEGACQERACCRASHRSWRSRPFPSCP